MVSFAPYLYVILRGLEVMAVMHRNVVLIDDEIHAVTHMRRLLETQAEDCRVIAHFLDGAQALASEAILRADIAFVDIMMPGMNGLALCKELKRVRPDITIVLLTAYKDFEYAHEAMRMGIHHYWVKHEIRANTIHKKMQELLGEMRQADIVTERVKNLGFLDALNGSIPLSGVAGRPGGGQYAGLLYARSADSQIRLKLSGEAQHHLCFGNVDIFLLYYEKQPNLLSECRRLQAVFGGAAYGALLSAAFKVTEYTPQIHQKLLSAVQNLAFTQSVAYADDALLELLAGNPVDQLEHDLVAPLEAAMNLWQAQTVTALHEILWQRPCIKAGNLMALRFVRERLDALAQTHGITPYPADAPLTSGGLAEHYRREFSKITAQNDPSVSLLIKRVKAYIHNNLASVLQLRQLTGEFNISADYLRKLFKQETGMTLAEYITQERIQKSILLLQTQQYKIYEIADRVGFRSAQYFSQVFYKTTGKYPTDYMK